MPDSLDCLKISAGAILFVEEGPGDCAYLIKRGEVEIFVERGDRSTVLARRGPGEILGEMALIDHGTRSASARAVTDCEFIVVTAQQVHYRIAQTDPILRMCLGVVIERYRETLRLYASGIPPKAASLSHESTPDGDLHRVIEVLTLERELERAIRDREFALYFQPIVHLGTNELAGFEALTRWNHPERGLVLPAEFIPVAEASGLIGGITQWCLREVARVFPRLSAESRALPALAGPRGRLFITVNVSGHDLLDPAFDQAVRTILDEGGVSPDELKLEITESVLMKDPEGAGRVLQACRRQGMGIAVDDFGTGYSSLSYLSTLPITTLKIDRAFVKRITEEGPSRKIVSTIRHLARELEIPVVAEGIETEAQAQALTAMNCEFGQGYLYGRPASLPDTLALIRHWPTTRTAQDRPRRVVERLCV